MAVWWLGNIILLVVIVPVVVRLLRDVVLAATAINKTAGALDAAAPVLVRDLEPIPALLETQQLVADTTAGLARYGAALDRIL
jgi:hypothetical protein